MLKQNLIARWTAVGSAVLLLGGAGTLGVDPGGAGEDSGVGEDEGGVAGGEEGDGDEAAVVFTSSFIPCWQCPAVVHMKYLIPADVSWITVFPPLYCLITFVAWQES